MKIKTSYVKITRERIEDVNNIEDIMDAEVLYHESDDNVIYGKFKISEVDGVVIEWEDEADDTPINSKTFDEIRNSIQIN